MWVIRQLIAAVIGLAAGIITAGGVFALITVIGIIPRMADVTYTGRHMRIYETAIIIGGILGNLLTLFEMHIIFGVFFLGVFGLCSGIFAGCLVMSLAETLDVFPITIRRCRLTVGLPLMVAAMALGKTIGALILYGLLNP